MSLVVALFVAVAELGIGRAAVTATVYAAMAAATALALVSRRDVTA